MHSPRRDGRRSSTRARTDRWKASCAGRRSLPAGPRRARRSSSRRRGAGAGRAVFPKLASWIVAGPEYTVRRDRAKSYSSATTCTRVRLTGFPACAGATSAHQQHREQSERLIAPGRPLEGRGVRDDRGRVGSEPLLEQGAVDTAVVGGRAQVALLVEAARQAGELADHLSARGCRSRIRSRRRRGRSLRPVLLRAPAELRPHVDEHAVREPARLEVALEREQPLRGQLERVAQRVGLLGVRVVPPRSLERDAVQRQAPASMAASPASRSRELSSSSDT